MSFRVTGMLPNSASLSVGSPGASAALTSASCAAVSGTRETACRPGGGRVRPCRLRGRRRLRQLLHLGLALAHRPEQHRQPRSGVLVQAARQHERARRAGEGVGDGGGDRVPDCVVLGRLRRENVRLLRTGADQPSRSSMVTVSAVASVVAAAAPSAISRALARALSTQSRQAAVAAAISSARSGARSFAAAPSIVASRSSTSALKPSASATASSSAAPSASSSRARWRRLSPWAASALDCGAAATAASGAF